MPFDKNEERKCIVCGREMSPNDTIGKHTQLLGCKRCREKYKDVTPKDIEQAYKETGL